MELLRKRILALMIDLSMVIIPGIVTHYFIFMPNQISIHPVYIVAIMHLFLTTVTFFYTKNSTIGQKVLKIRVVNEIGNVPLFLLVILRNVSFTLLFFGSFFDLLIAGTFFLSLLGVFVGDNYQTAWDKVFRTQVKYE